MYGAFLRKQNIFRPTKRRRKKILFTRKRGNWRKKKERETASKISVILCLLLSLSWEQGIEEKKGRKRNKE